MNTSAIKSKKPRFLALTITYCCCAVVHTRLDMFVLNDTVAERTWWSSGPGAGRTIEGKAAAFCKSLLGQDLRQVRLGLNADPVVTIDRCSVLQMMDQVCS